MLPANYILAVTLSVSTHVCMSVHTRRQLLNRKIQFVPKLDVKISTKSTIQSKYLSAGSVTSDEETISVPLLL